MLCRSEPEVSRNEPGVCTAEPKGCWKGKDLRSPGAHMGPYISRTSIRDSRAIRQGPSGPVGSYGVPTGFRRNPDLARQDPTGLDGSLDCPVSVYD